mgnify:CR=1 FL=1
MTKLKSLEIRALEQLLGMSSGWVLDFNDESFALFFREHDVDIDSSLYGNQSKAKRLRQFWAKAPHITVGAVTRDLIAHAKALGAATDSNNLKACEKAVARIMGETTSAQPVSAPTSSEGVGESDFLEKAFEIDVSLLSLDPALAAVTQQRLNEIKKAFDVGGLDLSIVFLCGSTLEGLLLDYCAKNSSVFTKSKLAPRKDGKVKTVDKWTLNDLVSVACDCRVLSKDVEAHSHSLRKFRNYIHPARQAAENFSPDHHTSQISWQVLKAAIADLTNKR